MPPCAANVGVGDGLLGGLGGQGVAPAMPKKISAYFMVMIRVLVFFYIAY